MNRFTPLSNEEAVLQERLFHLATMQHRKRLRYIEIHSRLSLLAALHHGLGGAPANRSALLAENMEARAAAYRRRAALEGAMRWIENAMAELRFRLPRERP